MPTENKLALKRQLAEQAGAPPVFRQQLGT